MVYNNKLIPFSFADDLVLLSNQKDNLSFVSLRLSDYSIDVMEEDDSETETRKKINTVDDHDFRKKKEETYKQYIDDMFVKLEKRDNSTKQKTIWML